MNSKLGERLQHELPNARKIRIPGCGHMPHVEKPHVIANAIADFALGDAAALDRVPSISCRK